MSRASEPSNAKKQQSKRRSLPTELQVINRIQKELSSLDSDAQRRVLSYVLSAGASAAYAAQPNTKVVAPTEPKPEEHDFLS